MKNVVLLSTLLFSSFLSAAQESVENEDHKFRFGFSLSANHANLFSNNSLPENAEISNGFGFGLGVLMDYAISEKWTVSPKSELSFYDSSVNFADNEGSLGRYEVFPAALNVMAHAAYKIGSGKVLPYVFVGPNFRIPLYLTTEETTTFETTPDLAIDLGFGLVNKLKHFVFAPELKYTFGFMNVNNNPLLQSLTFHSISLILNFK